MDRCSEVASLNAAQVRLTNNAFAEAWRDASQSGSEKLIIRACELFRENCEQLLAWEERVRFTVVPSEFAELAELLSGVGGGALEQMASLPSEISKVFDQESPSGTHTISIDLDLPPGWEDATAAAIERLKTELGNY